MERRLVKRWNVVGVISAVLFVILWGSLVMQARWLVGFDTGIQNLMHQLINTNTTQWLSLISTIASPAISLLLVLGIAGIFWFKREKSLASWLVILAIGGDAVTLVIKEIVRRARPGQQVIPDTGYSFPSGHSFGIVLLALVVWFIIVPRVKESEFELVISLMMILAVVMVLFSRIYLRAHYPSDVLASILIALTWWTVMLNMMPKLEAFMHKIIK